MKFIVMGGSFNPPTIAHFGLMRSALDALQAERGIYVPVSYAYLKRKMVCNQGLFYTGCTDICDKRSCAWAGTC